MGGFDVVAAQLKGAGRDVWTSEILKNFVVTSPSWESSVSHRLRKYLRWCAGCRIYAHLTYNICQIIITLAISCCF